MSTLDKYLKSKKKYDRDEIEELFQELFGKKDSQ